jgi:hypothetical protein
MRERNRQCHRSTYPVEQIGSNPTVISIVFLLRTRMRASPVESMMACGTV